ncbi:MAG: sulfate reduction electron transfer complex DsrMKJOP subunit DsrO [Candidatus Korobacteraceae bacterium]|jgi:molybdopterin-containing oxidoreductase family iron-sulfur binding subunit
MKITRKQFLELSGLSLIAAAAGKLLPGTVRSATEEGARTIRWGMAIDLQKCRQKEGCSGCIRACHTTHNVPQFADKAHEVKWIWKQPFEDVFPFTQTAYAQAISAGQPVMVLCNHCESPPCTDVCPVDATWKRDDGVVTVDWHRCIGCRYCMAACPYGARSFNWQDPRPAIPAVNGDFPTRTKGVVEKCNFCEERLAKGLAPACVAACEEKALVFGDLEQPDSEVRRLLRSRFAVQRKPELGTHPSVYYLL